jgi:hypothetical protein
LRDLDFTVSCRETDRTDAATPGGDRVGAGLHHLDHCYESTSRAAVDAGFNSVMFGSPSPR